MDQKTTVTAEQPDPRQAFECLKEMRELMAAALEKLDAALVLAAAYKD